MPTLIPARPRPFTYGSVCSGIRVLVACECSGIVRDAFRARGFDAMSCDLLDSDRPGPHYKGDVFDVLSDAWDVRTRSFSRGNSVTTRARKPVCGSRIFLLWFRRASSIRPGMPTRPHPVRTACPPSPDRWKLRSLTYPGIAEAMATQWGDFILSSKGTL